MRKCIFSYHKRDTINCSSKLEIIAELQLICVGHQINLDFKLKYKLCVRIIELNLSTVI